MSALPKLVSGFTVIPIAYAHSTHILYARAHRSKPHDAVHPENRTLFLVNIPIDATDREISLFFKACGIVERVVYNRDTPDDTEAEAETDTEAEEQKEQGEEDEETEDEEAETETSPLAQPATPSNQAPRPRSKRKRRQRESVSPTVVPLPSISFRTLRRTGSIAHVVFLDASSLEKALVPPAKPRPWPSSEEPRGLAHYAALYDAQRPPLDTVKVHADTWMERFEFDAQKAKRKSTYRKGEAIVDEDGFTLVTRGGAYGQTLGGGVGVASKAFEQTGQTGSKKKKEPKEKDTFYAFQKAEKQRKVLLDLRKNFEADKARIEKLKESRRFKPY